jgi:hypothetical protein
MNGHRFIFIGRTVYSLNVPWLSYCLIRHPYGRSWPATGICINVHSAQGDDNKTYLWVQEVERNSKEEDSDKKRKQLDIKTQYIGIEGGNQIPDLPPCKR